MATGNREQMEAGRELMEAELNVTYGQPPSECPVLCTATETVHDLVLFVALINFLKN